MKILPTEFDGAPIHRVYDQDTGIWWFSVIDIVQVLTGTSNARRYWSDLKRKLAQEAGSEQPYEETVPLKLPSADEPQIGQALWAVATTCRRALSQRRVCWRSPGPSAVPTKTIAACE